MVGFRTQVSVDSTRSTNNWRLKYRSYDVPRSGRKLDPPKSREICKACHQKHFFQFASTISQVTEFPEPILSVLLYLFVVGVVVLLSDSLLDSIKQPRRNHG